MTLAEALDTCSLGLLREIAARNDVAVPSTVLRHELTRHLAAALLEAPRLRALADRLSADARALLGHLIEKGGCRSGATARRWLEFNRRLDQRASEALIRDLAANGLVFRTFRADQAERGEWLCLPYELTELGGSSDVGVPKPPAVEVSPAEPRRAKPLLDLVSLADALRRSQGRVGPDTLSRLFASGVPGDQTRGAEERWRFLTWLAVRLGWFTSTSDRVEPSDGFPIALEQPDVSVQALWRGYQEQSGWDDRARALAGRRSSGDPRRARASLIEVLAELPAAWRRPDELIAWLVLRLPLLGLEPRAATDPPIALPSEDASTRVATYMLDGPLTWLGRVEHAPHPDGGSVVRPCGLRPVSTDRVETESPGTGRTVTLDRDGLLKADGSAALRELFGIARYLAPVAASSWRLTRESFAQGLAHGGSLADALQHLAALDDDSRGEWTDRLTEWESAAHGARLRWELVLDLERHPDRDRIVSDEAVQQVLDRVLSASAMVVRSDAEDALVERLQALGTLVERTPRGLRARRQPSEWLGESELALALAALESARVSRRGGRSDPDLDRLRERLGALVSERALERARSRFARRAAPTSR